MTKEEWILILEIIFFVFGMSLGFYSLTLFYDNLRLGMILSFIAVAILILDSISLWIFRRDFD
jgi:hypothetical protein